MQRIEDVGGCRFLVRQGSPDEVILGAAYREHRFFPPGLMLPPGSVILDAGAHIGAFSILAARRWPGTRIYAVEPEAENLHLLQRNIALNEGLEAEVIACDVALSSASGRATLHRTSENWGHALQVESVGPSDLSVRTLNLADFLAEQGETRLDFAKINIEGAEYGVLLEAPVALLKRVNCLLVEIHPCEASRRDALLNHLRAAGHDVQVTWDRELPGKGWLLAQNGA